MPCPGHDTDALFQTQDPDKLRDVALTLLSAEGDSILALRQRIHEPEEALKLPRFGRKGEAFTGEQRQMDEEHTAADRAGITRQLRDLLPERDMPEKKPVRSARPAHRLREETTLNPDSTTACPDCGGALRHIRDEVSEKLKSVLAHFVVHKMVRPQYGCGSRDTMHSAALPRQLSKRERRKAATCGRTPARPAPGHALHRAISYALRR